MLGKLSRANKVCFWTGFFGTLFLGAGLIYAESRIYLVKRAEHFPQDRYLQTISPQEYKRFVDTGKKDIDEAGGQPFRVTTYEINYDGKYALWNISFKDEDERWHLDSMERQGYIVALSTMEVVEAYDPRRGGNVKEAVFTPLGEMPTDYYAVEVSTP
jgi:hypothetical protein